MNFIDFILETLDWMVNFQPTIDNLAQLAIAVIGVTAVALSQSADPKRARWASVFGLVGQPAWFYSAMVTKNYGIFLICFLYTWAWGKGFWRHFSPDIRKMIKAMGERTRLRKSAKPKTRSYHLSGLIRSGALSDSGIIGVHLKRYPSTRPRFSDTEAIVFTVPDWFFEIHGTPGSLDSDMRYTAVVDARVRLSMFIIEKIKANQGTLGDREGVAPARPINGLMLGALHHTTTYHASVDQVLYHSGGVVYVERDQVTLYLRKGEAQMQSSSPTKLHQH